MHNRAWLLLEPNGPFTARIARLLPLLLCTLFIALQAVAMPVSAFSNDSYRYDVVAREIWGQAPAVAVRAANTDYCAEMVRQNYRSQLLLPARTSFPLPSRSSAATCLRALGDGVLPPNNASYLRIFTTRPGYPLLAAPFVRLLGGPAGLRLASILLTAAAGAGLSALMRLLGAQRRWCAAGQIGYWTSPLGVVGVRPLADGAAQMCLVAVLLAVTLIAAGRAPRGGTTLLVGALAMLGLVKYASATVLAAALVCAAAAALLRRSQPPGAVLRIMSVSVATAVLAALLAVPLHLPSASLSLQELFTGHLTAPPVPDPVHRLLRLDRRMWTQWAEQQAQSPVLMIASLLGLLGLLRTAVPAAGYVLACAGTGVVAIALHPTIYESDRLGAPMWLVAVIGVPLWLAEQSRIDPDYRAAHETARLLPRERQPTAEGSKRPSAQL